MLNEHDVRDYKAAAYPQPEGKATGTEGRVCDDIYLRQCTGLLKYGTTVADNNLPLREWLRHAYEEVLDQAIYMKRAMEELDKNGNRGT